MQANEENSILRSELRRAKADSGRGDNSGTRSGEFGFYSEATLSYLKLSLRLRRLVNPEKKTRRFVQFTCRNIL